MGSPRDCGIVKVKVRWRPSVDVVVNVVIGAGAMASIVTSALIGDGMVWLVASRVHSVSSAEFPLAADTDTRQRVIRGQEEWHETRCGRFDASDRARIVKVYEVTLYSRKRVATRTPGVG